MTPTAVLFADAGSINIRRWVEAIEAAGLHLEVVSFAGDWPTRRIHRLEARGGRGAYHLAVLEGRSLVRRIRPAVVIGYYATGYGTLSRLCRSGRPLVQVTAGGDILRNPAGTLLHRITARNLRRADLVVALAPHMAEVVIDDFEVDRTRVLIAPPGAPEAFLAAAAPGPAAKGHIVTTRALDLLYRPNDLIRAVAHLHDAHLTFAGDGRHRALIERHAVDLGVARRVTFLGHLSHEDLPAELARHRVYASLSPSDGVSASLIEAMAVGLLPVVIDHPANRWWINHGKNGLLTSGRADDVRAMLRRALDDDDLFDRARTANRSIVCERADFVGNAARVVERIRSLTG